MIFKEYVKASRTAYYEFEYKKHKYRCQDVSFEDPNYIGCWACKELDTGMDYWFFIFPYRGEIKVIREEIRDN
jgi:hypothetical protein